MTENGHKADDRTPFIRMLIPVHNKENVTERE